MHAHLNQRERERENKSLCFKSIPRFQSRQPNWGEFQFMVSILPYKYTHLLKSMNVNKLIIRLIWFFYKFNTSIHRMLMSANKLLFINYLYVSHFKYFILNVIELNSKLTECFNDEGKKMGIILNILHKRILCDWKWIN